MGRKKGIPGLSFSWKRATGISQAKAKFSRKTGIPLTKQARQRKLGSSIGCVVPFAVLVSGISVSGVLTVRYVVGVLT